MHIAMTNTLALISWLDFKFLHGDFTGRDSVWLLIGFLLALAAISALATQAALALDAPYRLQGRARSPVDVCEPAAAVSAMPAAIDGSSTLQSANQPPTQRPD
jgi:hypothetical protein